MAEPVTHPDERPPIAAVARAPDTVTLYQDDLTSPRFTPRELQTVKDHLGRSFSQILIDETTDDKFTVLAWLKLRRSGFTVGWEQMEDIVIEVKADVPTDLDPTSAARPTISPPSAATGE